MNIAEHIQNNAVAYILAAILGGFGALAYGGFMAYMDNRHIGRVDWINEQITDTEEEIVRLELYNQFGSEGNKPARIQVIGQLKNKKARLEREKAQVQEEL